MLALVWEGNSGHLSAIDLRMAVWEQPIVPGLIRYEAIRFMPLINEMSVKRNGTWLKLTDSECSLIEDWLQRWSSACRQAIMYRVKGM